MSERSSNLVKYMSNPRSFTLKRWLAELLKEHYTPHDSIVERVATALTTEKDLEEFGKLIGGIYEVGYRKAINDYKTEAEKLGLKVNLVLQPDKNA